jgi:hypothetical protein
VTTPNPQIDTAPEIDINRFIFWLSASSSFSVHHIEKLPKFPINPYDRLEIEPVTPE